MAREISWLSPGPKFHEANASLFTSSRGKRIAVRDMLTYSVPYEPRHAGMKLRNSPNLLEPLYRRSGFRFSHNVSVPVFMGIYFLISVPPLVPPFIGVHP